MKGANKITGLYWNRPTSYQQLESLRTDY